MAVSMHVKLNYDDLREFPNDGRRHELVEGEHIMTPAPSMKHQSVSGNLFTLFHTFAQKSKLGRVFHAPFDVVFSEWDVTEPDIVYISQARLKILTPDNVRGAPDLIVEILSPSSDAMDRKVKFKLYEKYGVREYWIIDPGNESVDIFILGANGYTLRGRFLRGSEIRSQALVGFACLGEQIFAV